MKKILMSHVLVFGLLGIASIGHASPVEYVRICSLYGSGFAYIPGTDICLNIQTGDARQATEGGTWRSLLPYPDGKWVTNQQQECSSAKLVKLGTFKSTDFTLIPDYERKTTQPFTLKLKPGEFISK